MGAREWEILIEEQERSGKKISEFCRERGIDRRQFSYNKHRLSRSSKMKPELKSEFIQVRGERVIEVALKNGTQLKVPLSQIKAVLEVLNVL